MEDILSKYQTSKEGLTISEAKKRLEKYGRNELEEKKPTPLIMLFLTQFVDALIALLVVAAIAAFAIGDVIDAAVIIIAVLLNATIGFIQEYRSQKAVETLKSLMVKNAVVKRENVISEIDSGELTIGDIVILEEGNKVPADLMLIEAKNLHVDESHLTGESEAIDKDIEDEVYMDSNILSGNGIGVVSHIGMDTTIGKIAELVQEDSGETPLQKRVEKLGKTLSAIAIIVCIFVFIMELFKGIPLVETFMTAVSLAVAAIPEGLPAVLTLTLALGMQQMAKSDAIVKRLLSVETLGSCTIICSDKTGTLTKNRMAVKEYYFSNRDKTLMIGALCNNATVNGEEVIGDQTDGAILKFCQENKYNKNELEKDFERIDEIPLDSNRKMMTTIHRPSGENDMVLSKGAPEIIIAKSKYIDNDGSIEIITPEIKETLMKKIGEMTDNALRVIGFAYKNGDCENPEEELTFVGMVGLIDPPKENTKKSVQECINAGIKVKMITGDHEKTAEAIAREIGILTDGKVITGKQLDELSNEEYMKIADDIQVYARVRPEQKMRIVETLKNNGDIVAMTGDGVNDAPALKKASIGISMGDGTDVAKEASDMILQNNDFSTIVTAIKEGRKIYDNIKRFVKFQVSTNVGAILTIVGASLLSLPIPFNPVQLLWINIVMDGPPAQTLGMEGAEKDIMQRKPETGDILNRNTLIKIFVTGVVMAIGTVAVFAYYTSSHTTTSKAMTVAFTLFVVYQLFNAYNGKANSEKSSKFLYMGIILSFILQLLIIYLPQLQMVFRTTGIDIVDWILIVIVAFTIIITDKVMNKLIQ
ncbi:MAG: calcium-translocating P-type ATPase, PMCA-type [Methanobrevibacter sp.]|uniref:calcium-translocating P-type ATPase, PMCA-type n=1 Tax=Methanobrevibacter sp. TaxID=66852 RepID=UPI0025D1DE5C|nr:calcium-translocating P-type ATPase, PMCA-type [Methanobrevibacter sp.]MBQ6100589.1 calcium-translocating P-type ATPase, PMCA-type [Methanobrevibacter sp.]MBQ6100620.1 calcium-translocating P-type ATPase, PMCA-type [Methanobrevibacter sp.]